MVELDFPKKLDPANNKTVVDLQTQPSSPKKQEASSKGKRKTEALPQQDSDDDGDDDDVGVSMDVDHPTVGIDGKREENREFPGSTEPINSDIIPMPASSSITALREKLHARMAALRQRREGNRHRNAEGGLNDDDALDKDELLEERRRQRVAIREKKRKERKGKKGKDREDTRSQPTKVCLCIPLLSAIQRN